MTDQTENKSYRVGLFHKPTGIRGELFLALNAALQEAGHQAVFRNPAPQRNTDPLGEHFDFLMLWGMQGSSRTVRDVALKEYTPVVVLDLGHLFRDQGSFQAGINDVAWLPGRPYNDEKRKALRIEYPGEFLVEFKGEVKKKGDKSEVARPRDDRFILVCGQKPGDAQHRLSAEQLQEYFTLVLQQIKQETDRQIIWRPHPEAPDEISIPDELINAVSKPDTPLEDALTEAFALVTYNSTCGQEALMRGIPVFCHSSAIYAEVANPVDQGELSKLINGPYFPSKKDFEDYFNRLTYVTWTLEDVKTGAFCEWLLPEIEESMAEAAAAREEHLKRQAEAVQVNLLEEKAGSLGDGILHK